MSIRRANKPFIPSRSGFKVTIEMILTIHFQPNFVTVSSPPPPKKKKKPGTNPTQKRNTQQFCQLSPVIKINKDCCCCYLRLLTVIVHVFFYFLFFFFTNHYEMYSIWLFGFISLMLEFPTPPPQLPTFRDPGNVVPASESDRKKKILECLLCVCYFYARIQVSIHLSFNALRPSFGSSRLILLYYFSFYFFLRVLDP